MSSFVVGGIIEARCTRCKDTTGHVVMACVGGIPVKVECKSCGSVHKYAPPAGKSAARPEKTVRVRAGHDRESAVDAASRSRTRAEKAVAVPKEKPSRTEARTARLAESLEQEWTKCVSMIASEPVPYSMDGKFGERTLVLHPVFGVGAVLELFPPDKMDVMFREGVKRLRCRV